MSFKVEVKAVEHNPESSIMQVVANTCCSRAPTPSPSIIVSILCSLFTAQTLRYFSQQCTLFYNSLYGY